MNRSKHIAMSLLLALASCAPKVEPREFSAPRKNFEASTKDARLSLRVREFNEAPPAILWNEMAATSEFFEIIDRLSELAEKTDRPVIKEKALALLNQFYAQADSAPRLAMQDTPFAALATAQTQEQVTTTLDEVVVEMSLAKPVIRRHVHALAAQLPTTFPDDLNALLQIAEDYSSAIIEDVPNMKLSPTIEEGLQKELINVTTELFSDAKILLDELSKAQTLSEIILILDNGIAKFGFELPEEVQTSLKQGRLIAKGLDNLHTPQAGLTVLVDIWRILTPRERMLNFKPANEALYNFLVKQDNKELECLRTPGCNGGVIDGIAKKVFILPKIKQYGLGTLRNEMNKQTRDYVLSAILDFAKEEMPYLPQTFTNNIEEGMDDMAGRILRVRHNYGDYVHGLFKVWGPNMLPGSEGALRGFEADFVELKISNKEASSLKALPPNVELNGSVAGTSLLANTRLIENSATDDIRGFEATLSQVNKLVAMSGYRDASDKLIPALLAPVDHKDKLLDILDFDSSKDSIFSFRLPDSIPLKDSFHADPAMNYARNFSAKSYAQQILGLSSVLRLTADWKPSKFDDFLGPIQAQDLTQDAEHDELKQALFPKDMLFALNLGNAAVLFQDATKKATPVFLLTLEDKILWADKYADATSETAIMGGIVDIVNGKKSDVAKTEDVAELLLAIDAFLTATEGVENTKSPILLDTDGSGEAPLQTLIAGKQDLKLLSVALANYLSHQLLKESSLVRAAWNLKTKATDVSSGVYKVHDQAVTLRALIKAHERTGIDAYLWSAKEIYFAMNKRLFDIKAEFYLNSDRSPISLNEKAEVLLAMIELRPYLDKDSQWQLDKIMEPWLNALVQLK